MLMTGGQGTFSGGNDPLGVSVKQICVYMPPNKLQYFTLKCHYHHISVIVIYEYFNICFISLAESRYYHVDP